MRSHLMGVRALEFGDGEHKPGDDHLHNRDGLKTKVRSCLAIKS